MVVKRQSNPPDTGDSAQKVESVKAKPVSLAPLAFEEAVRDLLRVKPAGKKSGASDEKK